VKKWSTRGSIILLVVLMAVVVVGQATTTTTSGCYKVGELIQFKVQDATRCWWWGNCSCQYSCDETQVTGWHIVNSSGETIFEVLHDNDGPVAASSWQGNWAQIDSTGVDVPPGEYTLYVDTSVGTLSRSLQVYDPCSGCGYCNFFWNCSWCNNTSTITTDCYCKTSLVLLKEESNCCWPLFRFQCSSSCP